MAKLTSSRMNPAGRRMHRNSLALALLVSTLVQVAFQGFPAGSAMAEALKSGSPAGGSHRYDTTPEFDRMKVCTVELITDEGTALAIDVRLADEPQLQAAGFQNIGEAVIEKNFILFIYSQEGIRQFHMRNVRAPLDIAYISGDGTIQEILLMKPDAAMPAPFLNLYKPDKPFTYALEARAGFYKEHRISAELGRFLPGSLCR
jgi:uncharacterized membrane protein (UPF0127 family)